MSFSYIILKFEVSLSTRDNIKQIWSIIFFTPQKNASSSV